ncbi:MAG: hypothetical protein IJ287_06935 [Methanobrevibacter sp.]|nr:hypothetical protein [Methanobrevibacter sp.]
MTWEWKIGDPVDDATGGSMDAMNWGHRSSDDDNGHNSDSQHYSDNNNYDFNRPYFSREQRNKRWLGIKKNMYENKLNEARRQSNDERRIEYYLEAFEYGRQYFEQSEKLGVAVDGMPDRDNLLSNEDVQWISEKHYDEFFKLHILSTDQTENLERLLKESGNGDVIKNNEELREKRSKEATRRRGIEHTRYLKKDYFERIQKANALALENNFSKAIKEYQRAVDEYDEFFQSPYLNVEMKRNMPEKSLTPEAVDHIMIIYRKNHPLLTSKKNNRKINAQIIDLLGGDWDERLAEADMEVAKIREQKNLERQRRKEKAEGIAVDVIVGARIVGDSILNRFKR